MSVHATATTGVPDDADDDADFVCPPFLGIANRLVLAQIVFATLSIIACSAAIAVLCETYIHTYVYTKPLVILIRECPYMLHAVRVQYL